VEVVMGSRSLDDLDPALRTLARQHIELCEASGLRLLVYCTWRSELEQAALYAQGRLPLEAVNAMRAEAGLQAIDAVENRRQVTRIRRRSNHTLTDEQGVAAARAYDAVPLDDAGHPDWRTWVNCREATLTLTPRWQIVVDAGERLGLVWGGRWEQRVACHWEMRGTV